MTARAKVLHVVAARPNYMKVAPLLRALESSAHEHLLVHTGQHYDPMLNDVFFRDLALRAPDIHLGVGSGSHAEQTARVMIEFERVVERLRPAMVVVAGDVNSTLACAIVAAKAGVALTHIEAGLRSNDRSMPEEINRVVTDRLTDVYLAPSSDAVENLRLEGVASERIHLVGNLMVDSLMAGLPLARGAGALERLGLLRHGYVLLTLHRPANVDTPQRLWKLLSAAVEISRTIPVVFPVHPRTRARIASLRLPDDARLTLLEPLGYLEFIQLQDAARFVATDSGGVQEETTALGVPCLTLRENTERPVTITEGTNELVGVDGDRLVAAANRILAGGAKSGRVPTLWDGFAGQRAAKVIEAYVNGLQRP